MKLLILILSFWVTAVQAGNIHTFQTIDTCYHWLKRDKLQIKADYAEDHAGAFYFYGDKPIYCWRSPLGAYSSWEDHGNELIRIKLKPGTQVFHQARTSAPAMSKAGRYAIYSNDNSWHEYTLAPEAVESWSMYHPNMIAEMKAELQFYNSGLVTADDVFYPFSFFNLSYLNTALSPVIAEHEKLSRMGLTRIYGKNKADHFKTSYILPWHKFLIRNAEMAVKPLPQIRILEASYGQNLDRANKQNATVNAGQFCDGKTLCEYKVHPKYLKDPAPGQDKDFEISWKCTGSNQIQKKNLAAPADGQVFEINCAL